MSQPEKLILPHGGYRKLKSFQVAQLAYDVTVRFAERYADRYSRTRDQMVQAARSGVQNIAESFGEAAFVEECLIEDGDLAVEDYIACAAQAAAPVSNYSAAPPLAFPVAAAR